MRCRWLFRMLFGIVRAEICMISLDAVLTWLLVVTLDLPLSAWPTGSPYSISKALASQRGVGGCLTVANFAMGVDDPARLVGRQTVNRRLITHGGGRRIGVSKSVQCRDWGRIAGVVSIEIDCLLGDILIFGMLSELKVRMIGI